MGTIKDCKARANELRAQAEAVELQPFLVPPSRWDEAPREAQAQQLDSAGKRRLVGIGQAPEIGWFVLAFEMRGAHEAKVRVAWREKPAFDPAKDLVQRAEQLLTALEGVQTMQCPTPVLVRVNSARRDLQIAVKAAKGGG